MPALAEIDLGTLTPDQAAAVGALRAEIGVLEDRNAAQADRIRRLEHLIRELNRVIYGKRSEKLTADERQLAFEDLVAAAAELEEAVKPAAPPKPAPSPDRPAPARNIGHLPEHLPRIERVIEPESTLCPCGCGEMAKIGEDRSERLDIVPAQLRVIVTVRPRYACGACERGVVQAPAPARLIEGGLPTEGALAHVLVSKYADHCPLYRQSAIYARSGLDPDRSTLAGWVGKAAFHLRPVADRLAEHLRRSSKLFMDETRVPVLDPGRKGGAPLRLAFCWSHARRRLREIHDSSGSEIAAEGLRRIAGLYAIEAEIRGSSAERRLAERQARSAPLVEVFGDWLKQERARVSPKSRLGEKLAYIARHWDGLRLFLADGRVEMDSNNVETLIRPIALNRKNALFAGHDEGAAAWGRIASLIETAKLNGVNPHTWLRASLKAIAAGHPNSRIDELLPWNFTNLSS